MRSALLAGVGRVVAARALAAVAVAFIVVTITFVVVRVLPGNPAFLLAGTTATEETVQLIERRLGLDQPLHVQYGYFVRDMASLDFGRSLQTGNEVSSDVKARIPATVELVLVGMFIGTAVGLILGVVTAVREGGITMRISRVITVAGAAIPEFWLGLILILVFYTYLGAAPAPLGRLSSGIIPPDGPTGLLTVDGFLAGDFGVVSDALAHLLLPGVALSLLAVSPIARVTRATMRSVLEQDFVLTARANGDRGFRLYFRRVLPVALPPIVTTIGLLVGYLLAGSFLLEKVFGWPGLGLYTVNAVQVGDFAVVQAAVLVAALVYVGVFLVADVVNALIDPRAGLLRQ